MTEKNAPNIFVAGSRVELVEYGKVIDVATVVGDSRSEIRLRSEKAAPGAETEFAYEANFGTWKMLFEGQGGERCTSPRAPSYIIRAVAEA